MVMIISRIFSLKTHICNESLLQTEGNVYRTIIVPGCKYIPVETFTQILRLANEGAKVIFFGESSRKYFRMG